jgi:hypothetical protein
MKIGALITSSHAPKLSKLPAMFTMVPEELLMQQASKESS